MASRQSAAAEALERRKSAKTAPSSGILGSIPTGPADVDPEPDAEAETAVAVVELEVVPDTPDEETVEDGDLGELTNDLDVPSVPALPTPPKQQPVIDRVGLDATAAGAAAVADEGTARRPKPVPNIPRNIPAAAPAAPAAAPVDLVDAGAALETLAPLPDDVFSDVEDPDARNLLRQAVQGVREAMAVSRARGVLPRRELSFVVVDDPYAPGRHVTHAQIFRGDMTIPR